MPKTEGKRGFLSPEIAAILIFAMLARGIYMIQLAGSDIGNVLPLDMVFYSELASGMVSGGGFPGGIISFNPLYPFFLRGIYSVAGNGLAAPRVIQSLLGLATICLIYLSARSIAAGRRGKDAGITGLAAAAMAALYPQFLLYEGSLLATSLVVFLLALIFTLSLSVDGIFSEGGGGTGKIARVPLWAAVLTMGLAAGAGSLGMPHLFMILAAGLPVWILARAGRLSRGIRLAAVFIAGALVFLLPPVIYNSRQSGRLALVTTHGGINFYIGNNQKANGLYSPPEGMRSDMRGLIEDARSMASKETGKEMTDAEASDFWFSRSVGWIREDPAGWVRLLTRKFLLFWNGTEVSDIVELSFYRKECPVLWILFLPFSVISALALPGVFLLFKMREKRSVTIIFLAASLASIMLFYANSRYRVPSVLILIALAALAVSHIVSSIREKRWRSLVIMTVSFLALFAAVSGRKMVVVDKSAAYTFLGNHYMQTGQNEKGAAAFAEALRLAPSLVMTRINYARVLVRQGKLEESRKMYASAFEKEPGFPLLAVELGSVLMQLGKEDEARRMFLYALDTGRGHDMLLGCQFLSRIAYSRGNREEAVEWLERALRIVPGDEKIEGMLRELDTSP